MSERLVRSRRFRPLAKAPLFRHPLIGPFLRLTGAARMPLGAEAGAGGRRGVTLLPVGLVFVERRSIMEELAARSWVAPESLPTGETGERQ